MVTINLMFVQIPREPIAAGEYAAGREAFLKKQHVVYLFSKKAVCPLCSGLLINMGEDNKYKCVDCHAAFQVVDVGMTDHEVICEQINNTAKMAERQGVI